MYGSILLAHTVTKHTQTTHIIIIIIIHRITIFNFLTAQQAHCAGKPGIPCHTKHYKLNYVVWYAKFIPRHTWCIKHKNHKHTLCIFYIYLRTFSNKEKFSFLSANFMKNFPSCLLFFRGQLVTFLKIQAPFSVFLYQLSYSTNCTCVLQHYTVNIRGIFSIFLRRLLFYTIYISQQSAIITMV